MLISVITASYNSEETIRRTIEGILSQTYNEIEYIIIDGASKDNTVAVAESYRTRFEERGIEFIIVSEPDHGIYDAMNKGIKIARGEIIGIINSDDYYLPNALLRVAETFSKVKFDMIYAQLDNINPDGSFHHAKHCRNDIIVSTRHWNHPTTFITKETYKELGMFKNEGSLYDDFDLYLRIRKAGKKRVILDDTLAVFQIGGTSDPQGFKHTWRLFKDKYACYRNNGYSPLYIVECFVMEFGRFFYYKIK